MPYVVNDDDFNEMMTELKVSNTIGGQVLGHMKWMDDMFIALIVMEFVVIGAMIFEWRFPHLVKKWFMPPEEDKKAPLLAAAAV